VIFLGCQARRSSASSAAATCGKRGASAISTRSKAICSPRADARQRSSHTRTEPPRSPQARHWLLCEGGWCLLLEALDSERPQNVDEKLLLGGVVALESLFGDLHLTSFLSRQLLGELRRHRVGEKRRLGVITRRHMYCVLVILWHAIRMKVSDYVRQPTFRSLIWPTGEYRNHVPRLILSGFLAAEGVHGLIAEFLVWTVRLRRVYGTERNVHRHYSDLSPLLLA